MKRTKADLAPETIKDCVAVEEWQCAGIEEAMASLEAGQGIPHGVVKTWVQSLSTDRSPAR